MAVTGAATHIRTFRYVRPKTFFTVLAVAVTIVVGMAAAGLKSSASASPYDRLRVDLAKRAEASATSDVEVPLSVLLANLDSSVTGTKFSDPALEEEIAYSIGRNNNVVWNRYLSVGKVPADEATFAALRNGTYEIPLASLFENGKLSPKYSIVDLRTALEFDTSAHFKGSVNAEYRAVVNDEVAFDRSKTYVIICHDGAADLSRSLIATAYLRSKGYSAYALKTGMRPILDRLGIPPAAYAKKTDYLTYSASDAAPADTFVDTLGALDETLAKKKYSPGFQTVSFPFYRMDAKTYESGLKDIEERVKKGERVRFACYDTFSCFYARIFIESYRGPGSVGMGIFR